MPTFKWTFRADDAGASKAMREFAASVKAAEASTDQASRKMTTDLDRVAGAAKRTQSSGLGGGIRNVAEATLTSGVSPLTTLQSAALSQFGGAQQVLAGVGTAALVAGAGVAAAGVAVAKFGTDSVRAFSDAAGAVDSFQDVTGGAAEQASVFVAAAQQLGVSSDALGGSVAKMLKSVNTNEGALREYGATVVRTAAGNVDAVGTFQSIAVAFASLTDPAKRAELASLAFGKGWTSIIDVLERGGPELDRFFKSASQHAPIFNQKDLADAVQLQQKTSELSQEWERFKVTAGKKTVPLFTNFVANVTDFVGWITQAGDATDNMTDKERAAAQSMFDNYMPAVEESTAATVTFTSALYSVADAYATAGQAWLTGLGSIGSETAGITAADDYESALSSLDSVFEDAAASQQDFADTAAKSGQQIGDAQRAVEDALGGVGEALAGVAEAQQAYEKVVADSTREVAQAQAEYAKTAVEAQRSIADVDERSAERIVNAQEQVADARRRAADAAVSSVRRISDAEQAVRDASVAALRDSDPYAANRRREEAEQSLARAKEDSAHDQQEAALNVGRSERDLADAHVQAARDREDAARQAAERIADAEQRISDANRQAADQITQAQKRIVDAEDQVIKAHERVDEANMRLARTTDEAGAANTRAAAKVSSHRVTQQQYDQAVQKTIDATPGYIMSMAQRGVPLDEINRKLQGGADKLKDQGRQLGVNTQLADIYASHANNAALQVLRMTAATYELFAALQRESKRLNVDAGIIAGDAGSLGLDLDRALRRDSGGPLPPGLSTVLNQTGGTEWVLTPSQVNALAGSGAGGGTTVVVQGSLITERDLASILADMKRKGF